MNHKGINYCFCDILKLDENYRHYLVIVPLYYVVMRCICDTHVLAY